MKKSFRQAVDNIEQASRDTDKVLKAARLKRNPDSYMTGEQRYNLLMLIVGCFAGIAFVGVLFLPFILG